MKNIFMFFKLSVYNAFIVQAVNFPPPQTDILEKILMQLISFWDINLSTHMYYFRILFLLQEKMNTLLT